jgi:hypothetical protein
MKSLFRIVIACGLLGVVFNAGAQAPGAHPSYLHALTDLRSARWFLSHQVGDRRVYAEENAAVQEIDAAIRDLKQASIDDGKSVSDHPPLDVGEHGSRLNKALETLRRAHGDVDQAEDNPQLQGLKHRILEHIDNALHQTQAAHDNWMRDGKP